MSVVDRLSVIYELQDQRYRAGMQRMQAASQRSNDQIIRGAAQAERSVTRSFGGISSAAVAAAAKVAALGAALTKLASNSQSYKQVENRLRSLGEYSDDAAERLASAAIRSRTDLLDMATTVARIQKATGDGYDQTIRRVETLNKLLAVGGATASEVNSVMMQLSQALTSGTLQGDELRSLRENAPIEFLDALAKAAGVTRGELKQLGADGQITSDIIVQALDELAQTADEKFGRTTQTVGQAFTNLNTGLTLFAGRLDEGLGATSAFSDALSRMGEWLTRNADVAEELGLSIAAGLQTGMEMVGQAEAAMQALADTVYTELVQGSILDMGGAFEESGASAVSVIDAIIAAIADMNGVVEGAAAAVREAFLQIPDAVSAGMQAAINAVLAGVEAMVNGVLTGIRAVAAAVDSVTGAAAGLYGGAGTNLAGGIGNVKFGRVEGLATNLSGGSINDAYRAGYKKGSDTITGFAEGARQSYNRNRAALEEVNAATEAFTGGGTYGSGGGSGGGSGASGATGGSGGGRKRGGGRGRAGRAERPFFEDIEKDLLDLQRQIELIGKSNEQVATAKARWEMLDEAKKRGIPVNAELSAQIDAQAAKVGQLTGELERAELAQEQFEDAIDGIAGAFSDALTGGQSLREGLAEVFKGIAADILKAGIRNALMSAFDMKGVGGGGGGNFLANIFGSVFGGFRASGGPISAGRAYMVGEEGPELVVPPFSAHVIPNHQLGGGGSAVNINISLAGANGNDEVARIAHASVMQGLAAYDKSLPGRVGQINRHPRMR